MLKKITIIFFTSLAFILLQACNCNREKEIVQTPAKDTVVTSSTFQADTTTPSGKFEQEQLKRDIGDVITPEELSKFLPAKITGAEKYAPSIGKYYEHDRVWTTASSEYVFNRKGFVSVAVFDYGPKGEIPEKKYYDELPSEPGMIAEKFVSGNARGYTLWNAEARKGKLNVLLKERYVIQVTADRIPDNGMTLADIYNMINVNKLTSKAK